MAVEMAADDWIAKHGRFALPLARIRAIDAYLLGDLTEQEYWSRIREMIEDDEESQKDREMAARAIVKPTKSTCD